MGLPVVRVTAYGGIEASNFNIYPIWRWGNKRYKGAIGHDGIETQ